ncbi:hypothetical protein ACQ4LE_004407 [Meloidogyne hapla]|uniref:Uncharacterized protein n=1 Tax=Meloidogyne hapla TaxID=6305 RepID=A0A1I8B729_MELHA
MDSRQGKGHSKEKPVRLAKATTSARLPSSSVPKCSCLVKATRTAKSSSSSLKLDKKSSCGCTCLVKATKTAKYPLVADDETINGVDNINSDNTDSFRGLQQRMNEKSSLRRMFSVVASSLGRGGSTQESKDEVGSSKAMRGNRLPPRGGMVQRGCSRGGPDIVKGTRTAIIPLGEEPSLRFNSDAESEYSRVSDRSAYEPQPLSWQEKSLRLPLPKKYSDNNTRSSCSGKSQAYFSATRRPSAVKVHSVEKFLAEEEKKERGARPCCFSAALREQMLRSRKGSCSVVKESAAEKTQSSSEYAGVKHQGRPKSYGKLSKSEDNDDQAGTHRLYGLEVVGQIFRVLVDGKELWTAHNGK